MASLSDAFADWNPVAGRTDPLENPQSYDQLSAFVRHVKEAQHVLGVVGGNEVARAAGNIADVESDLLGITRPNTDCATRKHLPPAGYKIERANPKINIKIDATPVPLKTYQMWAYPSVLAPLPLAKETCNRPEKY